MIRFEVRQNNTKVKMRWLKSPKNSFSEMTVITQKQKHEIQDQTADQAMFIIRDLYIKLSEKE